MSDEKRHEALVKGLVQVAGWINALIIAGIVAAATVVFLRATKKREFTIGNFTFPLRAFPHVLLLYTFAHAVLTILFAQKIELVKRAGVAAMAWHELNNSAAFLFTAMHPRMLTTNGPFGVTTYTIPTLDIAGWASLVFAVVAFAAVVASRAGPWRIRTREQLRQHAAVVLAASMIVIANWFIGSQWAILASSLAS